MRRLKLELLLAVAEHPQDGQDRGGTGLRHAVVNQNFGTLKFEDDLETIEIIVCLSIFVTRSVYLFNIWPFTIIKICQRSSKCCQILSKPLKGSKTFQILQSGNTLSTHQSIASYIYLSLYPSIDISINLSVHQYLNPSAADPRSGIGLV